MLPDERTEHHAEHSTQKSSGLGTGVGLALCGLVLLGFPKFVGLTSWLMWLCYIVGLIVLLVGILGTCIEWIKR